MIAFYLACGITIAFLENFSTSYFQKLIDRFSDGSLELMQIIGYAGILLASCIVNYLDEYPGKKLEVGIFLDLKLAALRKIARIDYEYYQTLGTGKLVQRIENGAEAGKGMLFDFYFCVIRQLVPSVLFSMIFIYRISPKIMFTILAGYLIVFLVTNLLLHLLYQLKERILDHEEKLNHHLVRGFMEMVVFRLNHRFKQEIAKATASKKEIVDAKVKMNLIHEAFFTIFALLITFVKAGILLYGWKTRELSIGGIVALLALVDHAYTPVAIFNVIYVQYKLDKTAYERLEDFLGEKEDVQLGYGTTVKCLDGTITLDQVTFDYGERRVLDGLSLQLAAGQKTVLVGESGSGKSTLIKLILGLLKPTCGTIHAGEYKLSEVDLNSYYEHISYIPQESPIFDGTLRENLVFDQDIDDTRILEVLEKTELSKLYHSLKDGLDTELGERGITLSGGERQRLALARLWFSDSDLIILDEATSAMDNVTEQVVMDHVMELLYDKTVIVIAHRFNTIHQFEHVLVFCNGKIQGEGSFEQLMKENEYFQELYQKDAAIES